MRSGRMNRAGAAALAAALCCAQALAERTLPHVPLPPLARAGRIEPGSAGWRQSGEISGSVALVQAEFTAVLARGGWTLERSIGVGRGATRSGLTLWSRNGERIMLMIREVRAGLCGFSWGLA
jgi:hypothetical protein